jgi:DNA-directed RNA polymerase specialized sigma24 family protein
MNWPEISDRTLVELCLQGREEAWCELLRRYERVMAGVIAARLNRWTRPDSDTVGDIVQECLRKLVTNNYRALRDFQWLHENALPAFLKTVACHAETDHRRKKLRPGPDPHKPHREVPLDEVIETASARPAVNADYRVLVAEVIRCLRQLLGREKNADRDVNIFVYYYAHGYTGRELAGLFGLGLKKAENIVARLGRLARLNCVGSGRKAKGQAV